MIVNNNRRLQPVIGKTQLKVGDKVVVRLTVRLDRTMDFVQLKDRDERSDEQLLYHQPLIEFYR